MSWTELVDTCAHRSFSVYLGRAAWFPLRYEGPITIEIDGHGGYLFQLPVYVEIVPLDEVPPPTFCFDGHAGIVVGIFRGGGVGCGGGVERFGPIWLDVYVPPGGLYALQLTWFVDTEYTQSAAVDCVRVVASPARPTGVTPQSWGRVKKLYR
jgi:hypothetical protein